MAESPVFNFLDDDAMVIPGVKSTKFPAGKNYRVPSPPAEIGLRFQALGDIALKVQRGMEVSDADRRRIQFDDAEEHDFARDVLSSVYDEMLADGVSWVRIQRITQYGFVYWSMGADAANAAASRGMFEGKAPALSRPEMRGPRGGQSGHPASTASKRRRRKR